MPQLMSRQRPGSMTTSDLSCVNSTGFQFVSTSCTRWQWWSTSVCAEWHLHIWPLTVYPWRRRRRSLRAQAELSYEHCLHNISLRLSVPCSCALKSYTISWLCQTSMASRHLRSAVSGCLAVTWMNTRLGTRNFAVAEVKIWNGLLPDLRLDTQSIGTFGQKLKQYL